MAGILTLRRREDVDDLLAELRDALRRSERTGGEYLVYRKDDQGQLALAVRVHLPPRLLRPRGRRGGSDARS